MSLILGSTIDISSGVLTLVNDQGGDGVSQINGNIIGTGGNVVINSNTSFGTSSSIFPINTFSGGLTLSTVGSSILPAELQYYSPLSLGTGTIIGAGGTLTNQSTSSLAADNTIANPWTFYTGPTTSFAGTLTYITGPITIAIPSGGTDTFATISGGSGVVSFTPSSLTINGATILVTNGNSITTGNIFETGSIQLGGGSHSAPIVDTLTITATGTVSYPGNISDGSSGTGAVVINTPSASGSVVTLTGDNTFTGGLTIMPGGSLAIAAAENVGAPPKGTISFEGGLSSAMTQNPATFSLPLPNSGITSIVTLDNDYSYLKDTITTIDVGGTTEAPMTLIFAGTGSISGSGSSLSAEITKVGGGILTFGTSHSSTSLSTGTYDITVKNGGLVYNLDSSLDLSAVPFLDDGVLRGYQDSWFSLADASYSNWKMTLVTPPSPAVVNVTLEPGTILSGGGEVTTVEVQSGAGIVPGDETVGVLTVTDSVDFQSGSTLYIRTNGSSASLLSVGDLAMLGSDVTLVVAPQVGNYTRAEHLVFEAGALSGEFSDIVVPASYFLDLNLDYSIPNQVILGITPRTARELATGGNAISVSNALDEVILWNRSNVNYVVPALVSDNPAFPLLGMVLETLIPLTTVEEMTDALNQLQPAFFKGFTIVQENNILKVQDTLNLRMEYVLNANSCYTFNDKKECCKPDSKIIHTWISGVGDVLAQDSNTYADSPQVGYQSKMGGFAAGADGHFAKVIYFGGIGGFTTSYIKWRGHQGTGNINTGYAGLYLSAIGKMFYGNLSLIGGFSDFSGRRHIDYTGVDLTAKGNHAGKQLLSHADTGINWSVGGFTIRPFDAFDYISQSETGYIEQGVGEFGLTLNETNAILIRNELGLEVSTCLCFSKVKWVIAPKASWVREVRVKGESYTASFTKAELADAPFTVTGYFPDRSLFSPGVSLTGSMCQDKLSVELSYKGEFAHGYSDHSYAGEVRYGF
ncbi:MAG: autotransporter domain-containing protein [Chlamydiota bacterium]